MGNEPTSSAAGSFLKLFRDGLFEGVGFILTGKAQTCWAILCIKCVEEVLGALILELVVDFLLPDMCPSLKYSTVKSWVSYNDTDFDNFGRCAYNLKLGFNQVED